MSVILISDQQGNLIVNSTLPNGNVFHIKIMKNDLIYLSDWNKDKIFRLQSNIICSFQFFTNLKLNY
jgi:hypothetical protein